MFAYSNFDLVIKWMENSKIYDFIIKWILGIWCEAKNSVILWFLLEIKQVNANLWNVELVTNGRRKENKMKEKQQTNSTERFNSMEANIEWNAMFVSLRPTEKKKCVSSFCVFSCYCMRFFFFLFRFRSTDGRNFTESISFSFSSGDNTHNVT